LRVLMLGSVVMPRWAVSNVGRWYQMPDDGMCSRGCVLMSWNDDGLCQRPINGCALPKCDVALGEPFGAGGGTLAPPQGSSMTRLARVTWLISFAPGSSGSPRTSMIS
jgi:hypothetical protein